MIRTGQLVNGTLLSLASLALGACGGNSSNAAPRLTPIPSQSAAGAGAAFTLDVGTYVTDREGTVLIYTVESGGGSFTGSVYTNMFDTLGTYPVSFRVSDALGKSATGSFDVEVMNANIAVVQQGDNLLLLDTDTTKFLTVTGATGFGDTFRANLASGQVVYDRSVGGTFRLFVYNPNTRTTATLGDEAEASNRYAAHTSSGLVLFTRTVTTTGDADLLVWDSASGATETISGTVGQADENPFVAGGLVFFERGNGGQGDLYRYDPTDKSIVAVSTDANDEDLQAVFGSGVIFTRIGGGGERDLFWFAPGTGTVEIGTDAPALATLTKVYRGQTATGHVVFEALAATRDLYVWDSMTGTTRAIPDNAVDETLVGVNANAQVLYKVAASPTNGDLRLWSTATGTDAAVSTDAANDVFNGLRADGDVIFTRETGTGRDLFVYDTALTTTTAIASASTADYVFGKVLGSGKVAYTLAGGSGGVFLVDPATLAVNTVSAVAGATFAGEGASGDAVARVPVAAQFDLVQWDESASAVVTISNDAGMDEFQAATASGSLLFTRIAAGQTAKELCLWSPTTLASTQLTSAGLDHAVAGQFGVTLP